MKRTGWPQFSLAQCLAVIWAISLLYCEWFSWCWASWQWTHVEPGEVQSELVKILLVADPQLIGYRNEPLMSGPFSRWDADRFVQFSHQFSSLISFISQIFGERISSGQGLH